MTSIHTFGCRHLTGMELAHTEAGISVVDASIWLKEGCPRKYFLDSKIIEKLMMGSDHE